MVIINKLYLPLVYDSLYIATLITVIQFMYYINNETLFKSFIRYLLFVSYAIMGLCVYHLILKWFIDINVIQQENVRTEDEN